jgi:hypothetical protein
MTPELKPCPHCGGSGHKGDVQPTPAPSPLEIQTAASNEAKEGWTLDIGRGMVVHKRGQVSVMHSVKTGLLEWAMSGRDIHVQPAPDVAQIETPPDDMAGKVAALIDYVLQGDLHNRLTPRVVDIAYSAFMSGRSGKNKDDGGPCDWFNDTKPMVNEQIAKIRAAITAMKGGE